MSGFFESMFGSKAAPTAPAAGANATINPNSAIPANPALQASPGNGVVPAGSGAAPVVPAAAATEQSGLDLFKDLWNNTTTGDGEANPNVLNVDRAKLLEAARKQDFVKQLPQELLQKISAGGADAMGALSQALNMVATSTYGQSTFASTQIMNQAMQKLKEDILSQLPGMVKQHTVSDTLRTENPMFSHPAAAPMLEAIQTQLRLKNPNATASELKKMSQDYLSSFTAAFVPKDPNAGITVKKPGETDWDTYMSL